MNKEFWKAAGIRALRTFVQVILAVWTAGQVITEVDWKMVFLSAVSAALYSLLTSILAGLPEVDLSQPRELTEEEAAEWEASDEDAQAELEMYREEGDDDE